jgi:ABC-type lipoprotein export system ATPase subunit
MVTHDLQIARNASRIVTMRDGRLVEDSRWAAEGRADREGV